MRPAVSTGIVKRAKRILIYGPGGVGKSQLESLVPGMLVLDLEGSTSHLDVARIDMQNAKLTDVRGALQDRSLWEPYQAVGIDTLTKVEELGVAHTCETVLHPDKGTRVSSIEGFGFGRGYQYVYDTFLPVLGDLDRIVETGRNVFLIAHECVNDTPNPSGEDFLRYEPRLQAPKSGKASIRHRVFEWADIVGYLSFDVVSKDGKGKGGGTRTLYYDARPTWWAKARGSFPKVIPWNTPTEGKDVLACLNN